MYTPTHFQETDLQTQLELIRQHPLGALVTHGEHGLDANHIPFIVLAPTPEFPLGRIQAHVAKNNPVWEQTNGEVMVLFQGPHAYISPSWYEDKKKHGKVVPTYNYAVVNVHGAMRVLNTPDELLPFLHALTNQFESSSATPWRVDDAPPAYVNDLMQAIVGIEITISRIDAKWKISQNKTAQDRMNIANGLAEQKNAQSQEISTMMADRIFNDTST